MSDYTDTLLTQAHQRIDELRAQRDELQQALHDITGPVPAVGLPGHVNFTDALRAGAALLRRLDGAK